MPAAAALVVGFLASAIAACFVLECRSESETPLGTELGAPLVGDDE